MTRSNRGPVARGAKRRLGAGKARRKAEQPDPERVIEIVIHDAEFLGVYGIEPRLYEGTEPIRLQLRPGAAPAPERGLTAEQAFFGAMARARNLAFRPSRSKPKRSPSKKRLPKKRRAV